jgi:cell division septum initiation protein DivIVA
MGAVQYSHSSSLSLGEDMEKELEKKQNIMDTPLPLILEGIETAAANANKAADEARISGEKAAEDVMKRLRKLFLKMAKAITEELEK